MLMTTTYAREAFMPRLASISRAPFEGVTGFTAAFCVTAVATA